MTALVAAVLGVNLGIFAALYWQQMHRRLEDRMRNRYYALRVMLKALEERENLASRLRWYTLR